MGDRDKIVAYCRNSIGCAYDRTPSGGVEGESYNCSYLTTCAYAAAGLEIPGWQGHQNGEGSQSDCVRDSGHWTNDPDELLPGDLVFFSRYGDPYNTGHVGVSLGGRRMIDSVPDGGVQERWLYDNFVGGGWPLKRLPEDEPEPEPHEQLRRAVTAVSCLIHIVDRNTWVWKALDRLHDLTDEEEIETLISVYATENDGKSMPVMQMTDDSYAHLVQSCKAGLPKHLDDLNNKFPPRS